MGVLMASERIQRRIDRLLDQADQAAEAGRWGTVAEIAGRVTAIEPDNPDAGAFLRLASASAPDNRVASERSTPYVAAHLSEQVREIRDEVVGERRTVTVLFADGVGFTAMSAKLDEEQVYGIAQSCLAVMTDCVHSNEGTVTQFRGDGIMALFGAPLAQEDSAVSAARAAVEMRDRLGSQRESILGRYGVDCQFRIGLHTGPVVVGSISEDLQMDFTAIGDTVNLAARMEQHADAGTIWCTHATAVAVDGFVVTETRPDAEVKGKADPVAVFELVSLSGAQTRLDAALARGLSRFVGREHELALLCTYVDQRDGVQPRCVTVVGAAGLGKSRLLLELQAQAGNDVGWVRGQCLSSGGDTPLLPFAILVRDWLSVTDAMSDSEVRDRFNELTADWEATVSPYLAFLLDLDVPELAAVDGRTLQAGVIDALIALLDSHDGSPPVLVIEDVHWIDSVSASVVQHLVESAGRGFLLLVTERPGYGHPLEAWSAMARIVLQQLGPNTASALAADSAGVSTLGLGVAEAIAVRTGGNPLFVEELTRCFVEQGLLNDTGELVAGVDVAELPAPASIQEVILARIDGLGEDAKSALQLASVIGREFSVLLLDQLARDPQLEVSLELLRVVELIRLANEVPELAFMFKHALTHDVAYSTLLVERRRRLHQQAAQAIEEIYADRLGEFHAELARHYETAELWEQAVPHLEAATRKAVQTGAVETALQLTDRLVEVSHRIADHQVEAQALQMKALTHLRAFNVHGRAHAFRAGAVFNQLGDLQDGLGDGAAAIASRAMEAMSYTLGHDRDRADRASAQVWAQVQHSGTAESFLVAGSVRANFTAIAGDIAEAVEIQRRLRSRLGEASEQTQAMASQGEIMLGAWLGQYERGIDASQAIAPVLGDPFAPFESITNARWLEVLNVAASGRVEEALTKALLLNDYLERLHDVEFLSRLKNTIGWIHYQVLDVETAEPWNVKSIDLTESLEEPDTEVLSNARLNLADLRMETGRLAEARVLLDKVGYAIDNPGSGDWFGRWRYRMHWLGGLARLHLMEDEPGLALTHSDELISRSSETLAAKHLAIGRRLRAESLLALGQADQAATEIAACIEVADSVRNPTQRWRAYLLGSEIATESGDEHLATQRHRQAVEVIRSIADGLTSERRQTFLGAPVIVAALVSCPVDPRVIRVG